ncbi:hypothetical protein HYR54_15175 [Candidatus Acetothermia bacterium]|nr:hypothetical protein [Candidatus Acetothermia bacterium]
MSRLRAAFGVRGYWLKATGQGQDPFPLNPDYNKDPYKGFNHARGFQYPYPCFDEAKDVLFLLCYKTALRLRAKGFHAKVVFLGICDEHEAFNHQCTLPVPTIDEKVIYDACLGLAAKFGTPSSVRKIGMGVNRFYCSKRMTQPIFEVQRKREQLLLVMDRINERYGKLTVHFGSFDGAADLVSWDVASLGMHRELELIEIYEDVTSTYELS